MIFILKWNLRSFISSILKLSLFYKYQGIVEIFTVQNFPILLSCQSTPISIYMHKIALVFCTVILIIFLYHIMNESLANLSSYISSLNNPPKLFPLVFPIIINFLQLNKPCTFNNTMQNTYI